MIGEFQAAKLYKRILRKIGYQKIIPEAISRDIFFEFYFNLKRPFVLQIGANDGKTHDSLYKYISKHQLPGLLVEPQPEVFERLKSNYKNNLNLKFANIAIGKKNGKVPFYRIKPDLVMEGKEYKASSGSSFYRYQIVTNVLNRLPPRRKDVLRYVSNNPNDYIEEISVKIRTLNSLLQENNIEKIDFLLTDTQGFDYEILKQLDFERFSPDIINFEHSLLTPEELAQSRAFLKDKGYAYFVHEGDTCAYKIM